MMAPSEILRHSKADCPFRKHTNQRMWPVQTLTLLLCLTDEEQLFAQAIPQEPQPAVMEVAAPAVEPVANALELLIEAEA